MNEREVVVIGGSRIGRQVLEALDRVGITTRTPVMAGGLPRRAEETARCQQERDAWNKAVDAKKWAKKARRL